MRRSGKVLGTVTAAAVLALVIAVTAIAGGAGKTIRTNEQVVSDEICVKRKTEVKIMRTRKLVKSEVAAEWKGKLIANVGDGFYLGIRESNTEDSKLVGKLYGGSGAEVMEKGAEWTRIRSGSVEGFVKNDYCLYGLEAKEYLDEHNAMQAEAIESGESDKTDYQISSAVSIEEEQAAVRAKKEEEVDAKVAAITQEREAAKQGLFANESIASAADETNWENSSSQGSASSGKSTQASVNDVTLLAAIIECESGNQPYAGKLAVGAVVMNRVHSKSFPNTISGVIYQKGQFTPVRNGRLAKVLKNGKIGNDCYRAAWDALAGKDNTGGAKFFHAGTTGRGLVIGTQIFY